jgi:hypothetical protein
MMAYQVVAVTGFAEHEVLSTHRTLEEAWYAANDVTTRRAYPRLRFAADGRQVCIVESLS